jgi:tRNA(Ile)-lysidine synthase
MQNVKYLAAVSGGPDSMALLDIYRKHIKMVCHVNYHHRPTANRDAKIVKQYCKQYKIPCSILNVTVSIYKKYRKLSHNFQTMARLIRYDLFKLVSKKTKITTILIAHNQDDFLETALMQKRKGSDSLFYGIDHRSTFDSLNVYRPLLNKRKACLQAYCDKHNLTYGIDETNNDLKYERNRIRSEINQ